MARRTLFLVGISFVALGAGEAGATQAVDTAAAQAGPADEPAAASQDEILVTARRRAENIQTVPVSVQAFSGETLVTRGITNTAQLQTLTPGVVFQGAGSNANTTFSIRGQTKFVTGAGLLSVISYVNEVPLPPWGSIVPTFDVANIQVLKGPQGTLFGRNTTGGAVLIYSQKPTFDLGGYGQVTLGSYSWHSFEGAINAPIVQDKIALRVAAQYNKRDGYTKELDPRGGGDHDNLNDYSVRASLLINPVDNISNLTVMDYFQTKNNYSGISVVGLTSVPVYRNFPYLNCGTSPNCDVRLAVAQQVAAGPRRLYSDVDPFDHTKVYGISNTTTVDLSDNFTIKNIFGFRVNKVSQKANTDGLPLALINSDSQRNDHQFSDELQFSGTAFDKRLNYIFGAFYLTARPVGPEGGRLQLFTTGPTAGSAFSSTGNNLYTDRSKAVFGNIGFELLPGLKLNGGARYTWDRPGVCAITQPFTSAFLSGIDACRATTGSFNRNAKFKAPTWNVGLDYQLNREIFAYGVVRHGYRSGGINTPALSTTGPALQPFSNFQSYGPQYVTDYEIGLKTEWRMGDVRGHFNVAAYRGDYSKYQRPVTSIPTNFDGDNNTLNEPSNTTLVINAGKARFQGFESDSAVSIGGLTLSGSLSYLDRKFTKTTLPPVFNDPRITSPVTFDLAPKWSYNVAGRYQLPFELSGTRFALNGDYYHISRYTVGVLPEGKYGIANASIEASNIGGSNLTASVFVTNLTNKLYLRNTSLSGTSLGVFTAAYGEPRIFGGRVRYSF